jgi:hypothetical protein
MSKLLFAPFGIIGGFIAGFIGKKLFEQVWGLIDEEEPPDGSVRRTTWTKLIVATALEGAIFRAVRAAVDRGTRQSFFRLTGSWPGDEAPDPE